MPDRDSNGVDILDRFLAYKNRFMQFSVTEDVFNQVVEYIKELRVERDEVRALYCKQLSPADPQKIAEKWRWDCFDNGKNAWLLPEKKQLLDKLVELDEKIEAHINNQKYRVTDGE
jgi:hypothetical protein